MVDLAGEDSDRTAMVGIMRDQIEMFSSALVVSQTAWQATQFGISWAQSQGALSAASSGLLGARIFKIE